MKLIDADAAIDAIEQCRTARDSYGAIYVAKINALMKIDALPSAQPMRKRGKWMRTYFDHDSMGKRPSLLYCSECTECIVVYPVNFCPNCGADMRGE